MEVKRSRWLFFADNYRLKHGKDATVLLSIFVLNGLFSRNALHPGLWYREINENAFLGDKPCTSDQENHESYREIQG